MRLINKVLGCALLASGLSFAHSGIVAGGSDGLHQINAKTLGQWNTVVGTGGTIATDAWAFTRGGGYEMNGQRHAFLDWAATMSGDFFIGIQAFCGNELTGLIHMAENLAWGKFLLLFQTP